MIMVLYKRRCSTMLSRFEDCHSISSTSPRSFDSFLIRVILYWAFPCSWCLGHISSLYAMVIIVMVFTATHHRPPCDCWSSHWLQFCSTDQPSGGRYNDIAEDYVMMILTLTMIVYSPTGLPWCRQASPWVIISDRLNIRIPFDQMISPIRIPPPGSQRSNQLDRSTHWSQSQCPA